MKAIASIRMCKLMWLCVWLLLPLALGEHGPSNNNATALAPLGSSTNNNSSSSSIGSDKGAVAELLPNAEKLIRYRRHPPYGKRGKHRRRTKGPPPKTKYGPPSFPPEPPISSYYKPASSSSSSSFPTHHELPSFSLDDFQHLKFDGADFSIPASSYEAQSMDLDLYSHDEPDLYGAHKFPSLEYSVSPGHDTSSFVHQPHTKYGVPPQRPSSGYDTPSDTYVGHPYETAPAAQPPSTKYGVPQAAPPPATKYGVPAHPPSTKYGVPSFTHSAALPPPDSYSVYEQKIPNAGYHHDFAEPPSPPSSHNNNFEISYSPPAYELSTSFQANEPQYDHNYAAPSPGHGYVPPAVSPGHSYRPSSHDSYQPPAAPPSHDSYQPPVGPPSHDSYQTPAVPPSHDSYQPPAAPPSHNSYQPPAAPPSHSYHPAASPPDSYQPPSAGHDYQPGPPPGHEYQPPPPSSHDSYQPPSPPSPGHDYQPPQDGHFAEPPTPPQHPGSTYAQPDTHQPIESYPQENYAPPAEELPLTPNHKFPSFDFPKSSYEVPIYDPIPFESSNKDEQESYPPILTVDSTPNELPTDDAHAAGSSRTPTKSRKRKRRPSAAIVSKKHTLDVPELQQAYDADSQGHASRDTELDTAAHGSQYVEKKRKYVSFVTPPATAIIGTTAAPITTPGQWSPMRPRTTASQAFVPTLVTSTPAPTSVRSRGRGTSRFRSRNPTTEPVSSTVVSIEKSRSQSYYDGTIAPPIYQQQYTVSRGPRPTRATTPQLRGNSGSTLALRPGGTERNLTPKRTTKGIFDTTLFKSPQTDREIERKLQALRQNLPKNHKLY